MNMLNSVILEGVVSVGINTLGEFYVDSSKYEKVGEDITEVKTRVKCLITNTLFVSECGKITEKRQLRVVGFLENIRGEIGIHAEHIEFKPSYKLHKESTE